MNDRPARHPIMTQKLTAQDKRYYQELRRESQKEMRRDYHRILAAFDHPDIDTDTIRCHGKLYVAVDSWLLDLSTSIKSATDDDPVMATLWESQEIGSYNGLKEAQEDFMGVKRDDLPAVADLRAVGDALEWLCVEGLDLPEQPPVIEDPWTPEEVNQA